MLFSKKGKFSNPPRQPQIGHILRNVDNRTEIDQLNRIIDVLTYKDSEAMEVGEGEESEYQNLEIGGLINPEFVQALLRLISYTEYRPIKEYVSLDTSLNTEQALNISEQYRSFLDAMRGNALRWDTQTELVGKEINKWMTNLTVQLKDIDERYSSQISRTSSTIDTAQIKQQMNLEEDKIDRWQVNEKKKIIESISLLFKAVERPLEEIIKKNKLFSQDDTLKSKNIEDLLPNFENHFDYLRGEANRFLESIEPLKQRFQEFKEQASRIDLEAMEKIDKYEGDLKIKLQDRDKQLSEFEQEKQEKITKLQTLKDQIEELNNKVKDVIQTKKGNCLQDAEELTRWAIEDTGSEFFSTPIKWFFMPVYAMFIEDEDMMEERMNIIFPGYISDDPNTLYEKVSNAFLDLKDELVERVEDDMKIRSNFEFSCEKRNYIEDSNLKSKIQRGVSSLKNNGLLNDEIVNKIQEISNKLLP